MQLEIRRLLLFVGCAVAAVGIGKWLLPPEQARLPVFFLGWANLWLVGCLFVLSLWRLLCADGDCSWRGLLRQLLPPDSRGRIAVIAVTVLLLMAEPFAFKIVMDEPILSSTAAMLHFDRLAGMPTKLDDITGYQIFLDAALDKRPLLFPFLLSLVHDLCGFRWQNVFILNGVLTFLLVRLIHTLASALSNRRGGLLAVLLAATLPLLGINATSGHFEILNLVMLCCVSLLGLRYIKTPTAVAVVPLSYALYLLTQVRYENLVFVLPFGCLILLGWWRKRAVLLPPALVILPLFYTIPLLHFHGLSVLTSDAFQPGPNDRVALFALAYAPENLSSAIRFLFSVGFEHPNSLLLSVSGLAALLCFLWLGLRKGKSWNGQNPAGTTAFFLLMAVVCHALVITFFNYGLFDQFITSRLSLPLHLLWIILVPYCLQRLRHRYLLVALLVFLGVASLHIGAMDKPTLQVTGSRYGIAILLATGLLYYSYKVKRTGLLPVGITLSYLFAVTLPVAHSHRYSQLYKVSAAFMEEVRFLESRKPNERILWVSALPYAAILNRVNFQNPNALIADPDRLQVHLDRQHFDQIYFSRHLARDENGNFDDALHTIDHARLEYEPVHRKKLGLAHQLEIYRVTGLAAPAAAAETSATAAAATAEADVPSAVTEAATAEAP